MNISGNRASNHSHWVADPDGVRVVSDITQPDRAAASQRIVVGVDGSDESIAALRRAARLAALTGSALDVVTSWDDSAFGNLTALGWDPEREAVDMLAYALDAVFGVQRPAWVTSQTVRGLPARVLVERSYGAEMLVLGKKSHRALTDLVMGSVSERCANTATCPVLIVPFAGVELETSPTPVAAQA